MAFAAVTVAAVTWPASTYGQLRLSIRASSALSVIAYRDAGRTTVEARLVDDLGEAVEGATIAIDATTSPSGCVPPRALRTDADGRGSLTIDAGCLVRSIRAAYEGARLREAIEETAVVAPLPPSGTLAATLRGGTTIDLDRPEHVLDVSASEGGDAAGMHVDVADELGRPVADAVLDANGAVAITIASARVGAPGSGRLRITLDVGVAGGNRSTDVWVLRKRRSRLALELLPDAESGIAVKGRLSDSKGGLAHETVAIEANGKTLGAVETREDGTFRFRFRGSLPHAAAPTRIVARYSARDPGRTNATSRTLTVPTGRRVPPGFFLGLLPIAVAIVVSVLAIRRSKRRSARTEDSPVVEIARRRDLRAARRAVSIRVVARRDAAPVAGALVSLRTPRGAVVARSVDAEGRVRFTDLEDGEHAIRVEADGHASLEFSVRSPHAGELDDVRVRLLSLRERALDVFAPVALAVLGERAGSNATVREVARRSGAIGLPADVPTDAERLAYAASPPDPESIETLRSRIERFLRSRRSREEVR